MEMSLFFQKFQQWQHQHAQTIPGFQPMDMSCFTTIARKILIHCYVKTVSIRMFNLSYFCQLIQLLQVLTPVPLAHIRCQPPHRPHHVSSTHNLSPVRQKNKIILVLLGLRGEKKKNHGSRTTFLRGVISTTDYT